MKKLFLFSCIALVLGGCARGCQSFERNTYDNHAHNVRVTHYSGGDTIGVYVFNGIVGNSENSDGYYFYVNGKLIEISGDVKIEYQD